MARARKAARAVKVVDLIMSASAASEIFLIEADF